MIWRSSKKRGAGLKMHLTLRGCVFRRVSVFLILTTVFVESGNGSDAEVLRWVGNAISRYDNVDLKASVCVTHPQQSSLGQENVDLHVKRWAKRMLLSMKRTYVGSERNCPPKQLDFIVFGNGDVLDLQTSIDSSSNQITGPDGGLTAILHSKRLGGANVRDAKRTLFTLNEGGVAIWVVGFSPLVEYFDSASDVKIDRAAKDLEESEVAIVASSGLGSLRMIVSKSTGWLPRWYEVVKRGADRYMEKPLAEEVPQAEQITWTGNVREWATDEDGNSTPRLVEVVLDCRNKDRTNLIYNTKVHVQSVVFDSPFDEEELKSDIVVPKRFRISISGASHLHYMWDGHSAVSGVPDLLDIRNLGRAKK
jgi:hypothetical protein